MKAPGVVKSVGNGLSKAWPWITGLFAKTKYMGKSFESSGKSVQLGVDPRTLNPTKDLSTLNPTRVQNAVKYGGDKTIIVDRKGNVLDGHHRLQDAINTGKSVDIQIGHN
ncbi:hypothetical protein [Paenibacillus nasutitermitis]|uniref:ParB/Sulfiredoxin domain-containing protein n=1 Tax=Paenibacillus nasutitermitis TaxID=1652958 RepID=A0A916YRL3_9BACL|nr:hypothetical protein [Paenibacillus nasutitermitis]GGD56780.1 hypothetical protein GCM10010911_13150 [Paenibacillus nasutitermitis]